MEVKEISGDSPGTTKVYQIDGKDVIDIGGAGVISDDFKPEGVEKIALTCSWIEHTENLNLIKDDKGVFSKIKDPVVYCADPQKLFYGNKEWVEFIEDGDEIELSGYRFEVIVVDVGNRREETMYYNSKEGILFCGDVPAMIEGKESIPHSTLTRLKEVSGWEIEEVYPAIVTDGKEMSDYDQEYIRNLIDSIQENSYISLFRSKLPFR